MPPISNVTVSPAVLDDFQTTNFGGQTARPFFDTMIDALQEQVDAGKIDAGIFDRITVQTQPGRDAFELRRGLLHYPGMGEPAVDDAIVTATYSIDILEYTSAEMQGRPKVHTINATETYHDGGRTLRVEMPTTWRPRMNNPRR